VRQGKVRQGKAWYGLAWNKSFLFQKGDITMTNDERNRAARLRRKLNKLGYTMRKTNWRRDSIDNFGGYAIIDTEYNAVVRGSRFDLDLDDVEEFISEEESIAHSE
jgi:hypothetical protein